MGDVIDINKFRKNKQIGKEFARDREPLANTHILDESMIQRLARIRSSLDRINLLMQELKKHKDSHDVK